MFPLFQTCTYYNSFVLGDVIYTIHHYRLLHMHYYIATFNNIYVYITQVRHSPRTTSLMERMLRPNGFSRPTEYSPLSVFTTLLMVSDVIFLIVSSRNRLESGSFPPLYFHVTCGWGLPLNGTSMALELPAFNVSFSECLWSPNVGGTAAKRRMDAYELRIECDISNHIQSSKARERHISKCESVFVWLLRPGVVFNLIKNKHHQESNRKGCFSRFI